MSTPSRAMGAIVQTSLIGENINDLPTPSILLDREIMKRHCRTLPAAAEKLGLDFRFHVKSHKVRARSARKQRLTDCCRRAKDCSYRQVYQGISK
jgi:hypothetical protein